MLVIPDYERNEDMSLETCNDSIARLHLLNNLTISAQSGLAQVKSLKETHREAAQIMHQIILHN